jgi:hypothetical protein
LLARGETLEVIKNHGLKSYLKGQRATAKALSIHAIGSLDETAPPDIIAITVKNYDLETTCQDLKAHLGDREPIVVALENGVHNQKVLPKYFSRVIYGVICYNAWRDGPGEVGHERKGYVILGTPSNNLQDEVQTVARIFGLGLDCVTTNRLQDAAHCKLVINQANALMTLVGFQKRPTRSFNLLVRLTFESLSRRHSASSSSWISRTFSRTNSIVEIHQDNCFAAELGDGRRVQASLKKDWSKQHGSRCFRRQDDHRIGNAERIHA